MADVKIKGPKGYRVIKEADARHGYNLYEGEVVIEQKPVSVPVPPEKVDEALDLIKEAEGKLAAAETSISKPEKEPENG